MSKDDLESKLIKFKALVLDADGVFFDGKETRIFNKKGEFMITKTRDFKDGQGLSLLRDAGILIFFASGEVEPLMSIIDKMNDLPSVKKNKWKPIDFSLSVSSEGKIDSTEKWLKNNDVDWADVVYIGDDLNDLSIIKKVNELGGLTMAPKNATRNIKKVVQFKLSKKGGNGAIREFSELVFDARNIDETTLSLI
jgi:YrbI family 3-deoxy-D-manno-octulosonate 8-phosphate phosphatase